MSYNFGCVNLMTLVKTDLGLPDSLRSSLGPDQIQSAM